MDQREIRNIAGTFATGVTVITTREANGKPVGMTANSFTSLSLNPPLVLFSIDKNASLYETFMNTKYFAINILSEDQEVLSRQFSKRNIDRFEDVSYEKGVTGTPILNDTIGYFDCAVHTYYDGGDHTIVVGEIKNGEAREGNPLLFYRGKYNKVAEYLIKQ